MTPQVISGRGVAVSLSTLPLEADSRAYRFAQTLAETGYRSIVIETRASNRRFWGDEIEVRSTGRAKRTTPPSSILCPGRLRNAVTMVRQGRLGAISEVALYTAFRGFDWREYYYRPRRLIPPAELYVLHSFELYRAVAPLARRLGARILYDAHDFYRAIEPQERLSAFDRDWRQPFLRHLEDRLAAEADVITTVGNGVAGMMAQALGRRPDVIRNFHDDRGDRVDALPLRRMLGLGEAHRLAVVVGNYKAGLAVNVGAAALQRLPENWHLAFIGRGYDTIAAELPSELVGRRLHLGHAVAPDEIVPTIRSADIGLVIYEPYSENYRFALPNGFFQAVAAGLPLVRGELPEIEATIGNTEIGYCLPRLDPERLARAMLHAVEERDQLHANTAALARTLRWDGEAARLRRLIGVPSASARLAMLGASG